jgi:hyperosmotically inducible protein
LWWSRPSVRESEFSGKEVVRKGLAVNALLIKFITRRSNAMKKRNIFISYLVMIMLIATFAACASTPKQESTGEYVDDSVITTKVKALLAEDAFLKSFQIGVETRKGIVQLSGFVDSRNAIDKAGQIARSVGGVKSVENNLILK